MSRASVLAALALGASAAVLPALASPVFAQDASADRYGPPSPRYPGAYAAPYSSATPEPRGLPPSGPPATMRGRTLSWPGKQDRGSADTRAAPAYASPTARSYPPQGDRPAAYARASSPPRTYAASPDSASPPYARRVYPGSSAARQPYSAPYLQPATARDGYASRGAEAYPSPPRAYAQPSHAFREAQDAPSPDGWRPVFADAPSPAPVVRPSEPPPVLAGAPNQPDLPGSIYTPASGSEMSPAQRAFAAPPPLRTASAAQRYGYDPSQGHQVRFYSVHRPFGLQPDAAPIPPQFFTNTADLSQPAGPLPTDRTTTTTTASGARVSHVAPDTSVN